jgi:hypothetical protein
MLKRLWNAISGLDWLGLGDRPARDADDDWECGPQGAGYLPVEGEAVTLPKPTRPAPPMPDCKPARVAPCECGKPTQCTIWSPTGPRAGHHKASPPMSTIIQGHQPRGSVDNPNPPPRYP